MGELVVRWVGRHSHRGSRPGVLALCLGASPFSPFHCTIILLLIPHSVATFSTAVLTMTRIFWDFNLQLKPLLCKFSDSMRLLADETMRHVFADEVSLNFYLGF